MLIGSGLYNNLFRNAGTLFQLTGASRPIKNTTQKSSNNISVGEYYKTFEQIKLKPSGSIFSYAQQSADNLQALKSATYSLSDAARSLGSTAMGSTDLNIAETIGTDAGSGETYDLFVQNLATPQSTVTSWMEAAEPAALKPGTYNFGIFSDSGSFNVNFSVKAGQTNADMFSSVKKAILRADIPEITAEVAEKGNFKRLEINSRIDGHTGAFDLSTDNNLTKRLGISTVSQAQDAAYSLNGQGFFSDSNLISLPESTGYVNLKGVGSAQIKPFTQADDVIAAAYEFANSYNTALSDLTLNPDSQNEAMSAFNMLNGDGAMTRMGIHKLSAMGITLDTEGVFVDAEKMKSAIEVSADTVKDALTGNLFANMETEPAYESPGTRFSRLAGNLLSSLMPPSGFLFDFSV